VWISAGISSVEVPRAMTSDAAKVRRVLRKDQLKDIMNLRKIDFLMKDRPMVKCAHAH
jgi:hypothetical protein